MSKKVFANGREVSAAKDDNKSVCAMPDVCLSPPSPPAGPIPIPYPNTSKAADTNDGSKTVKVGGGQVGLKNKSSYKKSAGNEAATRSLGMGVVTHTIQGKMKHAAWSFDVTIEGANVVRHMDLTTHNHINQPNIAISINQAGFAMEFTKDVPCSELDSMREGVRQYQRRRGTTVTTAAYTPPGRGRQRPRSVMVGLTPLTNLGRGWAASAVPTRPSGQKYPCSSQQMGERQKNHTESKIINLIFEQAGTPRPAKLGTLRMSVSHQRGGSNAADQWICGSCQKVICSAVKCGLDIELCEQGRVRRDEVRERCRTGDGWPEQGGG